MITLALGERVMRGADQSDLKKIVEKIHSRHSSKYKDMEYLGNNTCYYY